MRNTYYLNVKVAWYFKTSPQIFLINDNSYVSYIIFFIKTTRMSSCNRVPYKPIVLTVVLLTLIRKERTAQEILSLFFPPVNSSENRFKRFRKRFIQPIFNCNILWLSVFGCCFAWAFSNVLLYVDLFFH